MLWAPQQGRANPGDQGITSLKRVAKRSFLYLRRGIGVGTEQRESRRDLTAQFDLSPLRHRAIEVHELAGEVDGIELKFDLIVELIVVIHRAERQAVIEQSLLEASLESSVLLGLQIWI